MPEATERIIFEMSEKSVVDLSRKEGWRQVRFGLQIIIRIVCYHRLVTVETSIDKVLPNWRFENDISDMD